MAPGRPQPFGEKKQDQSADLVHAPYQRPLRSRENAGFVRRGESGNLGQTNEMAWQAAILAILAVAGRSMGKKTL